MNSTPQQPITTTPGHPSSLFPQITSCKTIRDLQQVHATLIKTGQIRDPLAAAELLRFCSLSVNHRDLRYARKIFNDMDQPNSFSYNTIIRALSEDEPIESVTFFAQMLCVEFVEINRFTFPSVLKACAVTARVEEGKQIHGLLVKFGFDTDPFVLTNLVRMYVMCGFMKCAHQLFGINSKSVRNESKQGGNVVLWNVMIDGYTKIGDLTYAQKLFERMPNRSVVSWNTMIAGYSQNGLFKAAMDLFREMQTSNFFPNYVTLVSVLPAISRLGALELGKWVHLYAKKNKIEMDDELGSALIDMYSKCGSIDEAIKVFDTLPRKNLITWNAIIGGLALHGRANDALHYFSRMEEARVAPSGVTYIAVLTACSHAGLVEEGRFIFNHMINVGLEPRVEHYGCMVDLLGRAGFLHEAEELILSMPFNPDDIIWKALLGACKMHGNIEMAQRVAARLMDLDPQDSGSYVALSNMYANVGKWEAVSKVRLKMQEMGIRKNPGCSWVELDGSIYEFLVEDDSHPKAREIHLMLEEISIQLKLMGYKPDTTQVFLNMDEEDKENTLTLHSEKIAIAFGLISTNPQTPLRIVKNLRICDDCHTWIKLISQIYKRKIIVRDRKRFHLFKNGACSCMDYW